MAGGVEAYGGGKILGHAEPIHHHSGHTHNSNGGHHSHASHPYAHGNNKTYGGDSFKNANDVPIRHEHGGDDVGGATSKSLSPPHLHTGARNGGGESIAMGRSHSSKNVLRLISGGKGGNAGQDSAAKQRRSGGKYLASTEAGKRGAFGDTGRSQTSSAWASGQQMYVRVPLNRLDIQGSGLLLKTNGPVAGTRADGVEEQDSLDSAGRVGAAGVLSRCLWRTLSSLCCSWGRARVRLSPIETELDEEAQEKVEQLGVSSAQLSKMNGIFTSVDINRSGTVYCSEILALVDTIQSPYTDHVFGLVGVNPDGALTFSELCRILLTYCVFSRHDILHFLFRQYDTDDSGAIDEREFRELAKTVNSASPMFPGNFAKALHDFDVNSDGLIDFEEFRAMDKAFPLLFFPAFRLQDSLQKHFLGSAFWLRLQERLLVNQGIEEYKAAHGGKVLDKQTLRRIRRQNR